MCSAFAPVTKWKELRRGQDEVVVLFKKSPHCLIPLGSHDRCSRDIEGCKLQTTLDLKNGLGLHQRALGWVFIVGENCAAALPRPKLKPGTPDCLDGIIRLGLLDGAAHGLEGLERALADFKHSGFIGQVAVEIARPGNALTLKFVLQLCLESRSVTRDRQRHAGVVTGLDREQHGKIGDIARHRPDDAHRGQPDITCIGRH